MKNSPIILLCGAAGSGKDTAAAFIKEIVPNTVTVAQADALKELGRDLFTFTQDQLWGPSESRNAPDARYDTVEKWNLVFDALPVTGLRWLKSIGLESNLLELTAWLNSLARATIKNQTSLTPRMMLQTLGTEFGRAISPDVWSNIALRKARELLRTGAADLVVITDGRFKNEILNARVANAITVLVTTPELNTAVDVAGVKGHASEAELKTVPLYWFDETILNLKQMGLGYYKSTIQGLCEKHFRNEWL